MSVSQIMNGRPLRLWVARLLVVCFALRALIPAGFMPDFAAAADGKFRVVICSAQGIKTVTLSLDGKVDHTPGKGHEVCPFASVPAAAELSTPLTVNAVIALTDVPAVWPHSEIMHLRRIGPILGSRGPPV
jgi:hypothetical protein